MNSTVRGRFSLKLPIMQNLKYPEDCRQSFVVTRHRDTAAAKDSGGRAATFLCLDCEGIEVQGLLCWWSLLRGTSCVTAPWVNWFVEWDFVKETLLRETWGQTGTNTMQTGLKNSDWSIQHEFESSPIKLED